MASLASEVSTEQSAEFFRRWGRFGGTIARLKKLAGDDKAMERWCRMLDEFPEFRLIHGRFTPLVDKLELVGGWPGVTAEALDAAVAEFDASERKKRFEAATETNTFLDLVVTVYRESTPATLLYARDRMRDAFGDQFGQWEDAYVKSSADDNRVRLLQGVPEHRNCVRIEVVDLGAHFNPKDGFIPKDVRGPKSATFAVIYAATENPPWVRQMDGNNVPFALVGGLELNVPGCDEWMYMPDVWRSGGRAWLDGSHCEDRYRRHALPVLWE